MAVLVVLLASWVVFRAIGGLGILGFGELAGVSALCAGGDVCHDCERSFHWHEA